MKCKICYKNETDNTSGICWECLGKSYFDNIIENSNDIFFPIGRYFRETNEGDMRADISSQEIFRSGEWHKY